jgi:hypothetical protein
VDLNGIPSVGWLLYLYQANTSTPVNSYQDTALTVLNPWPIPADAYGMMRQFWLADGSYRARATSSDGAITYFDQQTILALGASAGAAPSGGVDATAIFQTGDVMWLDRQGTRTGWVRDNGNTIGSASSGANEPGGNVAACQPLFEFLWNNFIDAICPVDGGRGGSSLSDWTANKRIHTPDRRGAFLVGLDNMGNSSAGRLSSAPTIVGDALTAASVIGENTHVTTTAEMPAHGHTFSGDALSAHSHGFNFTTNNAVLGSGGTVITSVTSGGNTSTTTSVSGGTPSGTIGSSGSGSAHNNVPISIPGTYYRKL